MRIVTGTISHETNVLSNIVTDLEEFRKRGLFYGEELFDRFDGTKTPQEGLLKAAGCMALNSSQLCLPRPFPPGRLPPRRLTPFWMASLKACGVRGQLMPWSSIGTGLG